MTQRQELTRGAGVLMPISALPSDYGIGTLGVEGYRFADFLKRIGCCYWQVLPVGPTSFGDSPYQSFSAFAGNPYFIDLEYLVEEGLLQKEEIENINWQTSEDTIDYARIYQLRFPVLNKAFTRSNHETQKAFKAFVEQNKYWLNDYSLYMAVKGYFNNQEWQRWDEDIKYRKKDAIERYSIKLKDEIRFWEFCQFKFHEQWNKLKDYVNQLGIEIIGDIPLYVAEDSSDVWVHGDLFELDERKRPIHIAGVPPDAFSDTGQRWGNPLYDWDAMEKDDFTWWRERMKVSAQLYDIIRIDHFIGVVNYYSIPAYSKTAKLGKWKKGPGRKLTNIIKESIGYAKIIAEDLGIITPNVRELIKETGYPGMKILEFGLDGPADHEYLPHNFKDTNLVAYTGTHDNETLAGYLNSKSDKELEFIYRYFNVTRRRELITAIIRVLYSSIADVAIVQMQDLLELDNTARMNFPSTIGGNWKWRMTKDQYAELKEDVLLEYAIVFARAPMQQDIETGLDEMNDPEETGGSYGK
jgi:4-alpha-glucanotransferase